MNRLKSILALSFMVFIPFGLMIWYRNHQSTGFASIELIQYPLLFGGLGICALFLIKRYFLKESLSDFDSGDGHWYSDLLWGIGLVSLYFILFYLERLALSNLLQFNPNLELLGLMLDLRQDPLLLLIWFGPVLWIGIALYEELIRIFILTELWKWGRTNSWQIAVVIISALIIGLVHWSQGPYGIVTVAIKGLVSGVFYLKKRRLMPLVYAHVLYDGIQVGILLLTYPEDQ